ncbi:histidine phosphatase family protein [Sulfobacillus harzensis]|uniref:Histidine phosphatase family protein n=1 Tax=Sulfobacillus harzensis TaxID=2729629 RepID=A0A7Y0L1K7_9FIRM|nr:histidine phosphatase family protein [Sulfobacillus harzensis]NMP21337.1 histidine phosphatase family protein [Sulfobacillus harzensis]
MAQVYDVLLVRHGESEANAQGRFAYETWDPPLTETGRQQALSLVEQLKNAPIRHIVTSPLLRAQETVQPLAEAFHCTPQILPDLAEVNLGIWDGKRLKDLEASHNEDFEAWRRDPEAYPPPGGESILSVGRRVLHALEDFVTSQEPGLTVAATHADCLKGAALVITRATGPAARTLFIPNCGQLLVRFLPSFHRWAVVLPPIHFA